MAPRVDLEVVGRISLVARRRREHKSQYRGTSGHLRFAHP